MLPLVDGNYKFLWVDVGVNGAISDCSDFNQSRLKTALENDNLGFPEPDPLPADDCDILYFLIRDDAFPLRKWLMKPFSHHNLEHEEHIFNYLLSRARRIVENAFRILTSRFQCLLTTLRQEPQTVGSIVLAYCCLHNLMRMRYPSIQNTALHQKDDNYQLITGSW